MIGSAHAADIGWRAPALRTPRPSSVAGLLAADGGLAAPLGPNVIPRPQLRRYALIALWESDEALDDFLAEDPFAAHLAGGWSTRLEPLRAHGHWPGLPHDIDRRRVVEGSGPVVVTTLARLRLTQTARFLRTTAVAEGRVVDAPGILWASGIGKPPFFATLSVWESARDAYDYAYDRTRPEHDHAITENRRKGFHRQEAYIRWRPYAWSGGLGGSNPLPADTLVGSDE